MAAKPVQTERSGAGIVVGIGASAGGLDAFKVFFSNMPTDTGMAFVIVQHLDPHHESSLAAIIGGYTAMPIRVAANGDAVRPNHIHVIPPDAILTIQGGTLDVARPASPAARRTSVNTFLTSLAQDQGENAVGIILSGFGSDGALGIAAIKERGGLTLSQADFDHHAKAGMPQSAASGGFVDHVLAVEDMPKALLDYGQRRAISDVIKGPDGIRQDLPRHLETVYAVLHSTLGRDFSQYKPGTLMRRIQRRMQVLGTNEVSAYIEQLRSQPDEAALLFRELLISVTQFFRDPDAFEALAAQVLPGLMTDAYGSEPIRVWVAGCATGEEAYSMAILLRESLARHHCRRPVQVFATDLDDRAIAIARAGLYPLTIAEDLSAKRLEQNFVKEDGCFRVSKHLREACLFSVHDIVSDPPFSRLDLITCRNLMIYFKPTLQQRVLATFHYGLRPDRALFLGISEGVSSQTRLFAPLDKRHRIYKRRDAAATLPSFTASGSLGQPAPRVESSIATGMDRQTARIIARYAPAFVIVDRRYDVLRFSGQLKKYIEPSTGEASLNLFALLNADLQYVVRGALKQAVDTGRRVLSERLVMDVGEHREFVSLAVEPFSGPAGEPLFLVAFREVGFVPQDAAAERGVSDQGGAVEALNEELLVAQERLRDLTEELEAAKEEYLSVNEELNAANEELETSREELQSLNEELQTINAELSNRNESLVRSNSDLVNLLDSTPIAILFLDGDMRIRRFTPRLLDIFKVREGDEGRPISDIVTRLGSNGLEEDVQQVLRTQAPIAREVTLTDSDTSYVMQIRPYRDLNNVLDGVIITFIDISERKRIEEVRSRIAAIVDSSQDAIISTDLDGIITSWNMGAEQLYGYPAAEAAGKPLSILLAAPALDDWPEVLEKLRQGERIAQFDSIRVAQGGLSIDVAITISPVKGAEERITGASVVARDITHRREAELKTALLLGELDHRVKNILAIVSAVVSQTLKATPSPEVFAVEVEGRIQAIAKAHSLLTQTGRGEMSLRILVETELAPYDREGRNLSIKGGDVALTPKAGMALALAIHELASNAAKYGALSTPAGHLAVEWTIAEDEMLTLIWAEAGGPHVRPPSRRGFGTTLIERALTAELDAEVNRQFLASGLLCTIRLALTDEIGRPRASR